MIGSLMVESLIAWARVVGVSLLVAMIGLSSLVLRSITSNKN